MSRKLSLFSLALVGLDQLVSIGVPKQWIAVNNVRYISWFSYTSGFCISFLILICLIVLNRQPKNRLAIGLLAAGWTANLLTYWRLGYIADYFPFWIWKTNLADVYIILGIAILIYPKIQQPVSPRLPER